jgi:hypothetical protein
MRRRVEEREPERSGDTLPASDPVAPESKRRGNRLVPTPRDEDKPITREDRTDYDEAGGPMPKI